MAILIDIKHVAHVNFFKPLIKKLQNYNYEVIISYIDRGRLPKIIKAEFDGIPSLSIGEHKGTKWSIIYQANIKKFFGALSILRSQDIDLMLGVDAFVTGFACKLLGIPNLQFYDDPERKVNLWLEQKTANEVFYPAITDFSGTSVKTYNALKEWAYLSPSHFLPNIDVLDKYGVKKDEYIFVREVDNGSLNYQGQESNVVASVSAKFPVDTKVLLSLEKKSDINKYPNSWILLQEPISDIHSLMYYSKSVISSGDSMAREGAMLGVSSYYVGFRDMAANNFIKKEGRFFVVSPDNLIKELIKNKSYSSTQEEYRIELHEKWIDVTDMMYSLVNKYMTQQK